MGSGDKQCVRFQARGGGWMTPLRSGVETGSYFFFKMTSPRLNMGP